MALISGALSTLQTRGPMNAGNAVFYHRLGVLNRAADWRYLERRVYEYRMLLDLEDSGNSRTLLRFGERE